MVARLPKATPTYRTLTSLQKAAINLRIEKTPLPDDAPSFKDWHTSQKESLAKQAKQDPEFLETLVKEYRNEQQSSRITLQAERYLKDILQGNIKSNGNDPRQR
jgi:hypothetical protein